MIGGVGQFLFCNGYPGQFAPLLIILQSKHLPISNQVHSSRFMATVGARQGIILLYRTSSGEQRSRGMNKLVRGLA